MTEKGNGKEVGASSVEGPIVVWSDWMSPNGQRWAVTMRAGCSGEAMATFAGEVVIAETLLIGAGWEPTDRKGPLAWPPADEQARRDAEVKELAAKMAVENAQAALEPTLLKLARHSLVRAAVALGVMKGPSDEAGAAAVKAAAKAAGLGDELVPDKLGDWVFEVGRLAAARDREALAAELKKAADAKAATPKPEPPKPEGAKAKAPVKKAPVQKQAEDGDGATGSAGGTIHFESIKVTAPKGKPVVEFWRTGRQYAEITWSLGGEKLLEQAPGLGGTFTVEELDAVGTEYAVAGVVQWEASANLNSKGVPYKDLKNVSLDE